MNKLLFSLCVLSMSLLNATTAKKVSLLCPEDRECIHLNKNGIDGNKFLFNEGEYKMSIVKERGEYSVYIDVVKTFKGKRFIKNDQVVIDKKLGLSWQDNRIHIKLLSWRKAIKYCYRLSLMGHKDWRLPAYEELLTIVDYSRKGAAIIPEIMHTQKERYWSYSPYLSDKNRAWFISFKDGATGNYSKSKKHQVRCVRNK